ncbi:potassium-transporting ATPase subunit KdpA [Pseudoduganella albidiflava]|uniref:Potassium-transporting ATPase potassium-binding subunit n=1 Tax=Pseudoduganella albidiflava TaxID=321983 RepID=A0A411WSJ0_9BURK|nr:potassium-transporting ATPase subunit KdpA [Pseudoduganella albidiflava]QBH99742.1 potassium-transporting ATPase subunit KdpA [Pseudoduganella albidiflava]GGY62761.1 potassium-transporting ATPase potassium-binding subunit [Pseudoduganella albidiflava]
MTTPSLILLGAFLFVLLALAWPLGAFLARVGEGDGPIRGLGWLHRFEGALYRAAGVPAGRTMGWQAYATALIVFNALGTLFVYAVQRLQGWLPLNPQALPGVSPDSSFNTAVSFVANTNWQGYAGEQTMSYLTQMVALAGQNFFSAATGIAVVFALIRAFAARATGSIGNFWVDATRATLYVLLPLSLLLAVLLMSQGVIQNFDAYRQVATLDGGVQVLAMGPVASQEAIKLLGTNGGGFFNANSAHPFENPTAFTNFVQMIAIFLVPAALCFAFGRMVGDLRQGWAVLAAMTIVFVAMTLAVFAAEQAAHPALQALGVDQAAGALQSGGNMEGKETRFGIGASALFTAVTTVASCGAVNAMHDSLMPLGGAVPLLLMQFGEVIFGGVGSGLYGMLVFAILAVFIAGLMIGRTPEYLGKKIGPYEMKVTSIAILVTPLLVLSGTAIAVVAGAGTAGIANPGAHGFSEILYAFSSAANNNGSAFAGLSANTPFYNTMLAIAMWFGRFGVIVPVLAIAGSLAGRARLPVTAGTMPTHGALFVALLIGVVLLVGVLNYVPALALGPVVEHLQLFH